MKIYTSYFSNIENLRKKYKNLTFISIAGITPEIENVEIFKLKELMPKYEWWKIWHDKFKEDLESEESKQWYIKKYNETVLSKLNVKEIFQKMYDISKGKDIILLCYETPEKFCHRHLVSEWLNRNGVYCEEK
jgi:uncharacterized protein YeaO (DUF488 family)